MKNTIFVLPLLILSFFIPSVSAQQEVNLYSARKEALIKPVLDEFTKNTGIKVNLVTGKADALIKRLQSEGRNTPADMLITTDAGRLHRASKAKLLQQFQSAKIDSLVPEQYRDREGFWIGLSLRARTLMYSVDRVNEKELADYEDLADPKWNKRICVRSSGNIYNQSLVASMTATIGAEATEAWARGLVKNMARKPRGGDRDQIKAVAAGQCDIAIANSYYLGKMIHDKDKKNRDAAAKVAIFWPNQSNRGTHVNISGAGISKYAKNKDNAVKLLEFLLSAKSQAWYAKINHEYPIRDGVEIGETLKSWGGFKSDALNLGLLGENNQQAVKIMDRAGWR
jgi:iron(III) transport system substrate-binding protein